jgi:catechol 2,3-dioxygenase-like lactoylglutathione lyase family enzyme
MPPTISHIEETCLYCRDLAAARTFYEGVLGLRVIRAFEPTAIVFRVDDRSVLIVFHPDESSQPERDVPSHGALTGEGHVAFRVEDLDAWREHLQASGVAIEQEVTWGTGSTSIYVRDPGNNSVELLGGPLWPA